jgi:carotenoid cleavage dioxygenase-like enzyme
MSNVNERLQSYSREDAYLKDMFAPVRDELTVHTLRVTGELPRDLEGAFLRNGPDPHFAPEGRYHWFDGDGMVHGLYLRDGVASYRNRYVRTKGFQAEQDAQHPLWGGILDPIRPNPISLLKNTSNTDLTWHAGRLLSLWWLCDDPYELRLDDLSTVGPCDFGGTRASGVSAHPKVDPRTGEMVFMNFSVFQPPYLQYGVVGADGKLAHLTNITTPAPRILHDIALTERYTILLDLPLGWDTELFKRGKRRITFDDQTPSRFGVIPRYGHDADVRWFEADPCYIYHTINAWEEGDEIVLLACRVQNPMPRAHGWDGKIPRLYFLELQPFLYRWRFHLRTGAVKEERLDDVASEFPRMNDDLLGVKTRFSYNPRFAPEPTLLFDALLKYDTDDGSSTAYTFGPGRFGSEPVFAPRQNPTAEDDGWLLSLSYDARDDSSSCLVFDAQHLPQGPIATIHLPRRVPIGFHACWVDGKHLHKA